MSEKNWDVIDKKEPRGQSVTYKGIPCTARTCVTYLNRFEKENEQLKKELHKLKLVNEMLSMDFSNSERELWRENEQLKKQVESKERLIKAYDQWAYDLKNDGVLDECKDWELERR